MQEASVGYEDAEAVRRLGWLARRIGSRVFRDLRTHRGFPLKGSIRGPLKGSIGFRDLRTHILRLLGPKTILYKAFGLF